MNAHRSHSHVLQIDTLVPVGQGGLGLTFCPGKYDPHAQTGAWDRDLETDLHAPVTGPLTGAFGCRRPQGRSPSGRNTGQCRRFQGSKVLMVHI